MQGAQEPLLSIEIQVSPSPPPPPKEKAGDDRKECNVIFNGMFQFTSNNIIPLESISQNVSENELLFNWVLKPYFKRIHSYNTSQYPQVENVGHLGTSCVLLSLQAILKTRALSVSIERPQSDREAQAHIRHIYRIRPSKGIQVSGGSFMSAGKHGLWSQTRWV